jgi:hypothetical protein
MHTREGEQLSGSLEEHPQGWHVHKVTAPRRSSGLTNPLLGITAPAFGAVTTRAGTLSPRARFIASKLNGVSGSSANLKAGIKVVVSSRDHREHDQDIERRDFQIAVVVFEKMQALLVAKLQLMEAVELRTRRNAG